MALAATADRAESHNPLTHIVAFLLALLGKFMETLERVGVLKKHSARLWAQDTPGVRHSADGLEIDPDAEMEFMRAIQVIGGAVITIAIVALVANEVLTLDAIANSSGPFSGVPDQLGDTGVAAITLLIIGLVVLAANRIMSLFGGRF